MSISRPILILALTGAIAQPATAQATVEQLLERCRSSAVRAQDHDDRARHCEVRESRVPAGALRLLAAPNGGVTVSTWDGADIVIRSVVEARAADPDRARALAAAVTVEVDGPVRVAGPERTEGEAWNLGFDVLVPARTDLDVEAVNGPISVTGVEGTARLRTRNGPISLRRMSGDVRASAGNGPVTVTLDGTGWRGGGLHAETVNGPISVVIPAGYAARIEGSTARGPIATDLPVTTSGRFAGARTIAADLNGGGPTLRFTTRNGPLSIRQH
jgi:hypothetical protein